MSASDPVDWDALVEKALAASFDAAKDRPALISAVRSHGMTPETFQSAMAACAELSECWDEEVSHAIADDLMCAMLRHLGYGEGVKVFEAMSKWYA